MIVTPTIKRIIQYLDGELPLSQKRRLEYYFIRYPHYLDLMKGIQEFRKNFKSEREMDRCLQQQKDLVMTKLFRENGT